MVKYKVFFVRQYTASIQLECMLDVVETIVEIWLKDECPGIFGVLHASMFNHGEDLPIFPTGWSVCRSLDH
jgi:hypothetical protein